MLPVSLDVALLKLQLPDLVLRPGMQVVARVASRGEGQIASLVLAGALLKATVPDEVATGQTLRLTVAETTPERIVLHMSAADLPATTTGVPLAPSPGLARGIDPDGEDSRARTRENDRPSVSLAYEVPDLGRLDLRIERGPEGVVVSLGTSPGWHGPARANAEALRAALEAKLETPAVVRVNPRREPFDAYA